MKVNQRKIILSVLVFIVAFGITFFVARRAMEFYYANLYRNAIILNQDKETIVVQENTALVNGVKSVKNSVFYIKSSTGKVLGSGIVLTQDGLAVTALNNLKTSNVSIILNGSEAQYEIKKRDTASGLALLSLKSNDKLSTVGFADSEELDFGERVYMISYTDTGAPFITVNEGIIKNFNNGNVKTNIFEPEAVDGSPIFSIDNRLMGVGQKDSKGFISLISVARIRALSGL
ncbi:MAG: serine protease [Candidatus Paceibacterota bacterium]